MPKEMCFAFVPCHHCLCSLLEQVTIIPGHRKMLSSRAARFVIVIDRAIVKEVIVDRGGASKVISPAKVLKYLKCRRRVEKVVGGVDRRSCNLRNAQQTRSRQLRIVVKFEVSLKLNMAEGKSRMVQRIFEVGYLSLASQNLVNFARYANRDINRLVLACWSRANRLNLVLSP